MIGLRAGAATDVGRVRANNEDHLLVAAPIFAVADGMGGHAAGEVASETAVRALRSAFGAGGGPDEVVAAVRAANRAVWDQARANRNLAGMGTTLTVVAQVGPPEAPRVVVANVGDSRTYRQRGDTFEQLTVDHNLVAELVAEGQITAEEAEHHPRRHVVTRVLGVYPDVDIDAAAYDAVLGDRYLLCSDGLFGEVTDEEIAELLRRPISPEEAAQALVSRARDQGGSDNITVVVVDVVESTDGGNGADVPAEAVAGEGAGGERATVAPVEGLDAAPSGARRAGRWRGRAVHAPRRRMVSVRVVAFLVLLVAVLGFGAAGTVWYARSGYFVGLDGDRLVIYHGRPGGVLGLQPTVAEVTATTTSDVESYHLSALRAGVEEPSLAAARRYVANLREEAAAAGLLPSGRSPTVGSSPAGP